MHESLGYVVGFLAVWMLFHVQVQTATYSGSNVHKGRGWHDIHPTWLPLPGTHRGTFCCGKSTNPAYLTQHQTVCSTNLLYLRIDQAEVACLVVVQLQGLLARHSLAVVDAVQVLVVRAACATRSCSCMSKVSTPPGGRKYSGGSCTHQIMPVNDKRSVPAHRQVGRALVGCCISGRYVCFACQPLGC